MSSRVLWAYLMAPTFFSKLNIIMHFLNISIVFFIMPLVTHYYRLMINISWYWFQQLLTGPRNPDRSTLPPFEWRENTFYQNASAWRRFSRRAMNRGLSPGPRCSWWEICGIRTAKQQDSYFQTIKQRMLNLKTLLANSQNAGELKQRAWVITPLIMIAARFILPARRRVEEVLDGNKQTY